MVSVPSNDAIRAQAFSKIFRRNTWNSTETKSGPGSTKGSTRRLAERLPSLLENWEIHSVLDAACGASFWMPDLPGYVGVDVVAEAIAEIQAQFPLRSYQVADICTADLPRTDAVIMRDVLAHLPTADVLLALDNARRAGIRWLLATSFRGGDNSIDTRAGGYHEIDLEKPPFSLGEPFVLIPDGYWEDELVYPNKFFGLWEL